jgi:hypothetical protein
MAQKRFLLGMAVVLTFGTAALAASCASAQYRPSPDMRLGESEPLLAGTTWTWQENDNQIFQFKAGGELVRQGDTRESIWSRDGDSVILIIAKDGNWYWGRLTGTYDASTGTIWGTRENSEGGSYKFTLTKYTGAPVPAAAPSASSSSSQQLTARMYAVTVWYTSSGTRLSSVYTVNASSKDEAEREAERTWKNQFGWNAAMQFQEAVAGY